MRIAPAPNLRLLAFLLALTLWGCAGANVEIVADRAQYPISMSGSVRDTDGKLIDIRALRAVGRFEMDATRLGIAYSLLTPRSRVDISDDVNEQVTAARGEAIVKLAVTVNDSCDFLNVFFPFHVLPIWPGCVPIEVHGLIVRRRSVP